MRVGGGGEVEPGLQQSMGVVWGEEGRAQNAAAAAEFFNLKDSLLRRSARSLGGVVEGGCLVGKKRCFFLSSSAHWDGQGKRRAGYAGGGGKGVRMVADR